MRRWLSTAALVCAVTLAGLWWWRVAREHRHDAVIFAAARRYGVPPGTYGVDPALLKAVVWRESKFNQHARGTSGEVGLMQINRLAAQEWADAEGLRFFRHEQLFDPAQNTLAGTWYLRKLLKRYAQTDNPAAYALADYNAGRSNVLRWARGPAASSSAAFLAQIDFPSTRRYVTAILERYESYRTVFPPRP